MKLRSPIGLMPGMCLGGPAGSDKIGYLADMIRVLGADLHVIAVCQAVVPALAATALLAAHEHNKTPRSLILIGGPVDPLAYHCCRRALALAFARMVSEPCHRTCAAWMAPCLPKGASGMIGT
jgi:hypothetical protein